MKTSEWARVCAVLLFPIAAHSETVVVIGSRVEDTPEKLDHILREVDGTKITVTKKTSVTKLDVVPTIIGNNQRELYARTPGLFVSEQQTPTQFNMSYRGLGNPQEGEYVLMLQDGLPISTDWIGFPTIYYMPLPQSLAEVQMLRGGSSLLYGPNPAPAVNLVSKRPRRDQSIGAYSENVGGSDDLFSTFNTLEASYDKLAMRINVGYTSSDGQRTNGDTRLRQSDLLLDYYASDDQRWFLDVHDYDASAGDPGKLSYAQFLADPDQAPTPFNRNWVRRTSVTLGTQSSLSNHWSVEGKLWAGWQNLSQRSAAAGASPTTATLVDEQFDSQGLDLRFVNRWGRGNAFTVGTVLFHDDAPFRQWTSTDINASRDTHSGTPRLDQSRDVKYYSVFAENVFRLPHRWHVVPSVRIERETIDIDESVRPPNLVRPLIDQSATRTVPMFGLGAGFDFGNQNETYFSVSQGYRPMRFFDVASPFSNVNPGGVPDPSKSLAWEAGVHGTPLKGLFYDASLFWIDFTNRIETIVISPTESVLQNSGDTRHRGVEAEVSYDFLANRGDRLHLTLFASASYLDAEFTKSNLSTLDSRTPAFAPDLTAKYGLTLRKDATFNVSVTGNSVTSQYFQDSNLPVAAPGAVNYIPAKVPKYTVLDVAGEWNITSKIRVLAGISNLLDKQYYNRVFQNGIEPGSERKEYAGLAIGF